MKRLGNAILCLGLLGYMIGCDVTVHAGVRLALDGNGEAQKTANSLSVRSGMNVQGKAGEVLTHTVVFGGATDADGMPVSPSSEASVQLGGGPGERQSALRYTATFPAEDLTRTTNKNRRPLTITLTASGSGQVTSQNSGSTTEAADPITGTFTIP